MLCLWVGGGGGGASWFWIRLGSKYSKRLKNYNMYRRALAQSNSANILCQLTVIIPIAGEWSRTGVGDGWVGDRTLVNQHEPWCQSPNYSCPSSPVVTRDGGIWWQTGHTSLQSTTGRSLVRAVLMAHKSAGHLIIIFSRHLALPEWTVGCRFEFGAQWQHWQRGKIMEGQF